MQEERQGAVDSGEVHVAQVAVLTLRGTRHLPTRRDIDNGMHPASDSHHFGGVCCFILSGQGPFYPAATQGRAQQGPFYPCYPAGNPRSHLSPWATSTGSGLRWASEDEG